VHQGLGHLPPQFAILGAISIAFEMLIDGTVGLTAGRLGSWLSRRQRARQALDAAQERSWLPLPPGWPLNGDSRATSVRRPGSVDITICGVLAG
jgi:hypothetical protein